jgi:DNA polymerase
VVLDYETYWDTKIGYGLRQMSITEYVRDARFKAHGYGVVWPGIAPVWVTAANIKSTLAAMDWSRIALIGHNLKFDGAILAWRYGIKPALYVDTLGMSNAVNGATLPSHSLGALAEVYELPAKEPLTTDGVKELPDFLEKEIAARGLGDVELTAEIFERMRDEFPEGEYDILDWTIRCFCDPKLVLDVPKLQEASKTEAARREAFFVSPLALEAAAAAQPEPTLTKAGKPRKVKVVEPKKAFASNAMFPKVLAHFGYETPMKPSPTAEKRGETKLIPALALGDPEFVDMLESEDPQLKDLCEARVAAKSTLFETRSGKLAKIGATGPWPFDVVYSGAKQTHRLSGGPGGGGNPQNLTSDKTDPGIIMRECVQAPGGLPLGVGDYAQLEPRVLAWLAEDKALQETFSAGDPYCAFGTRFYGRTITRADEAERKFSKVAVIAPGYGQGWQRLQVVVKLKTGAEISDERAKETINFYRSTYGAVPALWAYLENLLPLMAAGQRGFLPSLPAVKWDQQGFILPSGLRIRYPQLRQADVTRKGRTKLSWVYTSYRQKRKEPDMIALWGGLMTENLCQALAGEICKGAIRAVNYSSVAQIHDELLDITGDLAGLRSAMTKSPPWWPALRLDCSVGSGANWKEAK